MERIHLGHIVPGAPFEIERESSTTARINGNWGFGFVVTEKAMNIAIEKARTHDVAAMTVFHQSHIGRLGDYSTMAAAKGMIGIITADSGAGPKAVAPFGGRERRLGTNPISIAVPSDLDATLLLDMATGAVAAGKITLAKSRAQKMPVGWAIDRHGNPATNPGDYFDGGAILPLGADQGHKGSGLSFMVETLAAILTGLGFGVDPQARHNDGCFLAVFNVEAFPAFGGVQEGSQGNSPNTSRTPLPPRVSRRSYILGNGVADRTAAAQRGDLRRGRYLGPSVGAG